MSWVEKNAFYRLNTAVSADAVYDGSVRNNLDSDRTYVKNHRLYGCRRCLGTSRALMTFESIPIGTRKNTITCLPNINFGISDVVQLPASVTECASGWFSDTVKELQKYYNVTVYSGNIFAFKLPSFALRAAEFPNLIRKAVGFGTRFGFKVLKEIQYCHLRISDTLNNYQNWGLGARARTYDDVSFPFRLTTGHAIGGRVSSNSNPLPDAFKSYVNGGMLRTYIGADESFAKGKYYYVNGSSGTDGGYALFYSDIQCGLYTMYGVNDYTTTNRVCLNPPAPTGRLFSCTTFGLKPPSYTVKRGYIAMPKVKYTTVTDSTTGLRTVTYKCSMDASGWVNVYPYKSEGYDDKWVAGSKEVELTASSFEEAFDELYSDPFNNMEVSDSSDGNTYYYWKKPNIRNYFTKDGVEITDYPSLFSVVRAQLDASGVDYRYTTYKSANIVLKEGVDFEVGADIPIYLYTNGWTYRGAYAYTQVVLHQGALTLKLPTYPGFIGVDLIEQYYDTDTGYWGGVHAPLNQDGSNHNSEDIW